ncbi:MAG: pyridoxamine 5'-phosphate oxidase family protein [Proteobacteria bacterium]|nr:pyridoxamine 5'-phosphate oxidase family protein [Pseudomonadota bacterium]
MSRRDKIRMSDEEISDFLRSSRTMILVSNGRNGYPHPMPMWFAVDDDNSVLMTTFRKSQKVRNLKKDPRVSLLVEAGEKYQELKSLLIYTEVEIIDDIEVTIDVMFKMSLQRGDVSADQEEAVKKNLRKTAEKRVVMRFNPGKIVSWDHSKLGGVY